MEAESEQTRQRDAHHEDGRERGPGAVLRGCGDRGIVTLRLALGGPKRGALLPALGGTDLVAPASALG
ncbi:hypothetical protein ADL05_10155 [Nocardiopsis sp. NRRL B-16309]|nr:hypothetical protein ADL05_10155 [Nocardiopsis sp. NRRL B-16309]